MKTMKVIAAAAALSLSGVKAAESAPECPADAPYCMTGYGGGVLPYWGAESALIDARKYAGEGFPIEVWTSFGERVFTEMSRRRRGRNERMAEFVCLHGAAYVGIFIRRGRRISVMGLCNLQPSAMDHK